MNKVGSDIGPLRRMIRFYTFNTPVRKGVYRVASAGLHLGGRLPDLLEVTSRDGRKLLVDPSDPAYRFLYFTGQYEPGISKFISRAVFDGDVCIDIGANIGWYTTLHMRLVGPGGEVHAFEPMPGAFRLLEKNVSLNCSNHEVYLNRCAVGDRDGEVEMFLGSGLPEGHTGAAASGPGEHSEVARITPLYKDPEDNDVSDVSFVQADIEGSELAALRGTSRYSNRRFRLGL